MLKAIYIHDIYIYIYIYISCMYVCMHVCIHKHTHTHCQSYSSNNSDNTHIHTHTYIHALRTYIQMCTHCRFYTHNTNVPGPSGIEEPQRMYDNFGYTLCEEDEEDANAFMECFHRTCTKRKYKRCG
jgi:hypothetical protein